MMDDTIKKLDAARRSAIAEWRATGSLSALSRAEGIAVLRAAALRLLKEGQPDNSAALSRRAATLNLIMGLPPAVRKALLDTLSIEEIERLAEKGPRAPTSAGRLLSEV